MSPRVPAAFAAMARWPAMTLLHLGPPRDGLANLHNAARGSPVFSVVGDMAVWHSAAEAPLKMTQALKHTVSCWAGMRTPLWLRLLVREGPRTAWCRRRRAARACARWCCRRRSGSQCPTPSRRRARTRRLSTRRRSPSSCSRATRRPRAPPREGAAAAGAEPPVGGASARARRPRCTRRARAARSTSAATRCSSRRCDARRRSRAVGATLCCVNSFARVDRGRGRPPVERVPSFLQQAAAYFEAFSVVLRARRRPSRSLGTPTARRRSSTTPPPRASPSTSPTSPPLSATSPRCCRPRRGRRAAGLQGARAADGPAPPTSCAPSSRRCSRRCDHRRRVAHVGHRVLGAVGGGAAACAPRAHGRRDRPGSARCRGRGGRVPRAARDQSAGRWPGAVHRTGISAGARGAGDDGRVRQQRVQHPADRASRQKPKHGGRGDAVDGLTQLQRPQIDWVHLGAATASPPPLSTPPRTASSPPTPTGRASSSPTFD